MLAERRHSREPAPHAAAIVSEKTTQFCKIPSGCRLFKPWCSPGCRIDSNMHHGQLRTVRRALPPPGSRHGRSHRPNQRRSAPI